MKLRLLPGELTPLKDEALRLLARGPMTFTPDVGWRSFSSLAFNCHTIFWLASKGWAAIAEDGVTVNGTAAGVQQVEVLDADAQWRTGDGTKTDQIKQVGNAVSVEMMEAEVTAIMADATPKRTVSPKTDAAEAAA